MIKPLRIDIKIRNNALIRRREELGMSASQFAKAAGVGYCHYLDFESMKTSPIYKDSFNNRERGLIGWKETALRIANYHGVGPDVLWSDLVLGMVRTRMSAEVDAQDLARLTGHGLARTPALPDAHHLDNEKTALVRKVLATLSPREERVLRLRFGIGVRSDHTLEETSDEMSLRSREIARQIETKALAKLRAPARRKLLKPLVMDVDEVVSKKQRPHSRTNHPE